MRKMLVLPARQLVVICFSVLALLLTSNGFAGESKPVEKHFRNYWSAFASGQFERAVDYIYEDDLQQMKNEFLPIFEEALQSRDERVRQVGQTFFSDVAENQRGNLSARDIFQRVTRFGLSAAPDALKLLKSSPMLIDQIEFTQKNEATVTYHLKVKGQDLDSDIERLIRVDGKWFLRLKDVQKNAVALRQALLAQQK